MKSVITMKSIVTLLAVPLLAFSLTGCGGNTPDPKAEEELQETFNSPEYAEQMEGGPSTDKK